MPITTDLDRFRLELGDTDATAPLFQDDEAQYFIDKHPTNLLLAVADACDALAARFARQFDFDANDQKSFKRSQMATLYAERATALRARALAEGDGAGGASTATGDLELAHAVRNTPITVTVSFLVDDIPTDATGDVTVTVTRENGDTVTTGEATSTSQDGQYAYALTSTDTADLDVLRLTWEATVDGGVQERTTFVAVRGAALFSIADARQRRPLDDADAYPIARLVEARVLAETALERACNVAFTPSYFRVRVAGARPGCDERTDLLLPIRRPLTITAATIDGDSVDTTDIALYSVGRAYREDGWGEDHGPNVELTGTRGYEIVPPLARRGCLMLAKYLLGAPGCDPDAAVLEVPEAMAAVAEYGYHDTYAMG